MCSGGCGGSRNTSSSYLVKGKTREERLKELAARHQANPISLNHNVKMIDENNAKAVNKKVR